MKNSELVASNRMLWEEAAPIHKEATFSKLEAQFKDASFNYLDEVETNILQNLGLEGKHVGHLCCNNGREILSVKRMGADKCTGFDYSSGFVEQARALSDSSGIECEFVCSDVLSLPEHYEKQFDLILITVGTLYWMPDIEHFFLQVSKLLKPQGQVFIHELHPLMNMFPTREPAQAANRSYFQDEPKVSNIGLDYWNKKPYKSKTKYWFCHTLSRIFSASLGAGFTIEDFKEYAEDISLGYTDYENCSHQFPLSMHLVLQYN